MLDMNRLPFTQAKWFTAVDLASPRTILWLVLHSMEAPEKGDTAESIANYFHTINEKNAQGKYIKKSAHTCWDNNSAVRCVMDRDVAYAAPGANSVGLQYELAGYGRQTRDEWLDPFGRDMLALVCEGLAQDCIKYSLPPKHLSDDEIRAKKPGIIGHYQASRIFKLSDHTDPGTGFPWDIVTLNVGLLINQKKGPTAKTPQPGERRWSNYFYKQLGKGWIVLTTYTNDTDWWFYIDGVTPIKPVRAQTPWSQMPLRNPLEG